MKLPLEYRWLRANKFEGLIPWYLIEEPGQNGLRVEYQKETGEDFFPFARRQDCDDVAGLKIENGEIQNIVLNVHLTWSGKKERDPFPATKEYSDIFEWLKEEVIPATREWMSEEELEGLE